MTWTRIFKGGISGIPFWAQQGIIQPWKGCCRATHSLGKQQESDDKCAVL